LRCLGVKKNRSRFGKDRFTVESQGDVTTLVSRGGRKEEKGTQYSGKIFPRAPLVE